MLTGSHKIIWIDSRQWLEISIHAFQVVLCNFLNKLSLKNTMRCATINKQYMGLHKISQIHFFSLTDLDESSLNS